MPVKNLYYQIKPYLPWGLRMAARRIAARRIRKAHQAVWPINEKTGFAPAGWPGWPGGKKFAFVLTHDVEGAEGLAKCRKLMQLEQKMGLHSSFNFIPESGYTVSRELREELAENGFEVGLHDLRHDGKLYQSRQVFAQNAKRINGYLREWGTAGFRSGFMLHEMDWLHDLELQYDSSTFDTDPFEPQPDGVHTIFPFWVPHPTSGGGYVELPYTLPQDSTLFLLLRESKPEIWLRKLEWIVRQGGMALVNVHPDYLRFPGEAASSSTYPVQHYLRLIQQVQEYYKDQYWHALPREVALTLGDYLRTVPGRQSAQPRAAANGKRRVGPRGQSQPEGDQGKSGGKRICVIRHGRFPDDPRVRKEVNALLDAGYQVDVLCLHQDSSQPRQQTQGALRITRIPVRHRRQSLLHYCWEYSASFALFSAILTWRHFRRRYDFVQINTMPDALVFTTVFVRLTGTPVILDVHEPTLELWVTKYGGRLKIIRGLILLVLRAALRYADEVITVSEALKKRLAERGGPNVKIAVIPNVAPTGFGAGVPHREMNGPEEFVLLTHGLIEARYGHEMVIRAVHNLSQRIPGIRYEIIGEGEYLPALRQLVEKMGCGERVTFRGYLSFEELVQHIRSADAGVIALQRSPYSELIDTNKMYEYMMLNVPVIHSRLPVVDQRFNAETIAFFTPDDGQSLEEAILRVYSNPEQRCQMASAAKVAVSHLTWEKAQQDYLRVFEKIRQREIFDKAAGQTQISP